MRPKSRERRRLVLRGGVLRQVLGVMWCVLSSLCARVMTCGCVCALYGFIYLCVVDLFVAVRCVVTYYLFQPALEVISLRGARVRRPSNRISALTSSLLSQSIRTSDEISKEYYALPLVYDLQTNRAHSQSNAEQEPHRHRPTTAFPSHTECDIS